MAKNIILCSDGTGNKGGYGADTNVFKIYNAVDIYNPQKEQFTFYDDGVGTNTNKYIRSLGGAFGIGFRKNVIELYKFLARNYEEGDGIYLFGFSRGAATVRAFAGMVQECGLIFVEPKAREFGDFDENRLEEFIKEAMKLYICREDISRWKKAFYALVGWTGLTDKKVKKGRSTKDHFERVESLHKKIKKTKKFKHSKAPLIKFIGVWDTVSALGFPQDWSKAFDGLFKIFEEFTDLILPHKFYNYQLAENVKNVYHAIAIDDERKTFHPKIWREKCEKCGKTKPHNVSEDNKNPDCDERFQRPVNIEQVWFAGVHSNVGGGYERPGMSLVALDWIMERAKGQGLEFKKRFVEEVQAAANVHEKLYDSRDGFALYYRYAPRRMDELCQGYIDEDVKIHQSVIDRIRQDTARYAPGFLPFKFEITNTRGNDASMPVTAAPTKNEWQKDKNKIEKFVNKRERLYRAFAEISAGVVLGVLWFLGAFSPLFKPPGKDLTSLTSGFIQDALEFIAGFLPPNLSKVLNVQNLAAIEPFYIWAGVAVVIGFLVRRQYLLAKTKTACEKARTRLLYHLADEGSQSGS